MAKNANLHKGENDRIQIRSFWISEKKTPYIYNYLKKNEISHKGDQLDIIRAAISTGIVLNNLFPELANFISGLNERLTLGDLNRFLNGPNYDAGANVAPFKEVLEEVLDHKLQEYLLGLKLAPTSYDKVPEADQSIPSAGLQKSSEAGIVDNGNKALQQDPLKDRNSTITSPEIDVKSISPVMVKANGKDEKDNSKPSVEKKGPKKANKHLANLAR